MTLSLNNIVSVEVSVSAVTAIRAGFNIGCIIGTSSHISAAIRVKSYTSLADMISDGWAGTEPEYKAAQLYFAQSPAPSKVVIGRWDNTGTETAEQAVAACRIADTSWYACMVCGAVKADILAIAPYIESASPTSAYFYTTSDADVPTGTAGNIFLEMQAAGYRRSIGQYCTSAPDGVAGIMGYALGANTGLENSAYTLAYKSIVGLTTESGLTDAQVTSIKNANGNVYVNRGITYNVFEQGVTANGTPFDEVINLDVLANSIQQAVMNLLTTVPKVPQTDAGVGMLISAITDPCNAAKNSGFLAPGVWKAGPLMNLNTGDTLAAGYLIMADTVANQSQADRTARKAPPIYVAVKLAGAVEHVVINIQVNR